MSNYIVGDLARVRVSITDEGGAAVDPGTVMLVVLLPNKERAYPSVTRTGTGEYFADVACSMHGLYLTSWATTSPYVGADEGEFIVSPSALSL